jgi:hypothetical protein
MIGSFSGNPIITNAPITSLTISNQISCQLVGSWNSGTCTVDKMIIASGSTLSISSGITVVFTDTISNSGTLSNSGTINHIFSTTTYFGIGTFTNTGTIAIRGTISSNTNLSTLGYPIGITTFSILSGNTLTINSGTILTIASGYTINNLGIVSNSGTIKSQCGATYSGTIPTGNLIVDACVSCSPTLVDWTITSSCQLSTSVSVTGNVLVQNNSVLVIPSGKILDVDFATKHLLVKSGSKVLIKSGGKID